MHYTESMERMEGPRPERDVIYEALENVTEYEMLQIHPDGVRVLVYVNSDELEDRLVQYGGTTIKIKAHKQIPFAVFEGRTFEEVTAHFDSENGTDDDTNEYELPDYSITGEDYKEWVRTLVTRAEIQEAVLRRAMATERDASHETLTCVACGGKQKIALECWCLYDEQTYSEGEEWTPQKADPNCETCTGSGLVENDCSRCDSIGVIAKNPFIEFFDEETGQTNRITLDLAHLTARGDIELEEHIVEYQSPDSDHEYAYRRIAFDVHSYIRQKLQEFGYDPDAVGIVTEDGVLSIPGAELINVDGGQAHWRKKDGVRKRRQLDTYESLTADEIVEVAQQTLARQFATNIDRLKNESGLVGGEEWVLRKLPPFEESFELFKQRLFNTEFRGGYLTLGYTQYNPDNGNIGPAFFVLDQDGNRIYRVSCDTNIHASLETARVMFEALTIFAPDLRTAN